MNKEYNKEILHKVWKEANGRIKAIAHVDKLVKSPYNIRIQLSVSADHIEELAKNIRDRGLIYSPIVNSKGHVFIGWNRVLAYRHNKEKYIEVIIQDNISPEEMLEGSFDENYYRKTMHYLDEGRVFTLLCKMKGISQRELAKRKKLSQSYVNDRCRIWKYLSDHAVMIKKSEGNIVLDRDDRENYDKVVTFSKSRELSYDHIPKQLRKQIIEKIVNEGLSYRELKRILSDLNKKEWLLNQSDVSEHQLLLEKDYPEDRIYDIDISHQEVEERRRKYRQLEFKGVPHSKDIEKIQSLIEDNSLIDISKNSYLEMLAKAYFNFYGGEFDRFRLSAVGRIDLEKKKQLDREGKAFDISAFQRYKQTLLGYAEKDTKQTTINNKLNNANAVHINKSDSKKNTYIV